jgi:DNA polymerase-1
VLSPVTNAKAKELFQDSVSDQVLQWILENENPENWAVGQFIGYLQDFREMHKDLSTYYDGYTKLVWEDGIIRPNYQNCATRTGRQSCTQPNLQNVSKGE